MAGIGGSARRAWRVIIVGSRTARALASRVAHHLVHLFGTGLRARAPRTPHYTIRLWLPIFITVRYINLFQDTHNVKFGQHNVQFRHYNTLFTL